MENKENPYIKSLSSGLAVVSEMALGGLFMENLKMEKQRTSKPYPFLAKRVLSQGIKGFEAGLLPWGVTVGMSKGMTLGFAHSTIKNICKQHDLSTNMTNNIAGFGAGAFQGMCISPLMLARIRVNEQIAHRSKPGTWIEEIKMSGSALNKVIKNEGIMSLTKGMGVTAAKRSMDWGLRFGVKRQFDNLIEKYNIEKTIPVKMGSAFASGTIAAFITMPIDRTIPLLQSSKGGNFIKAIKDKFKTEGVGTLFRGYGVRAISTGYHTTFALFVSDSIYRNLKKLDNSTNKKTNHGKE